MTILGYDKVEYLFANFFLFYFITFYNYRLYSGSLIGRTSVTVTHIYSCPWVKERKKERTAGSERKKVMEWEKDEARVDCIGCWVVGNRGDNIALDLKTQTAKGSTIMTLQKPRLARHAFVNVTAENSWSMEKKKEKNKGLTKKNHATVGHSVRATVLLLHYRLKKNFPAVRQQLGEMNTINVTGPTVCN